MNEPWQQQLRDLLTDVNELSERFNLDPQTLGPVVERYPLRISPAVLDLIEAPGDPIWRQFIPDPRELEETGLVDPLGEENLSPVPSVVHRYPDRALFLVSSSCASYCRFCTRKRRVGCVGSAPSFRELRDGIDYIAAHPQIRDVLFSGGDPLLLPDAVLGDLLNRVHQIPHVEIIRIGSRVPLTLPTRITPQLCQLLKKFSPLFLNTHFNHPRELTPEAGAACHLLADHGIVLGNQTVLLKGVNDDPALIQELFFRLLKMRVRPYYLHQMDLVRGGEHFRTPLDCGLDIMAGLRGPVSGLASPHFVVDLPGGKGKVPLLPGAILRRGRATQIRSAAGELIDYPDAGSENI
ncbi:KamA family radical SAM protein [Geopsychrobacter electrodiphilus]|uniref:KamA family radical SAM protein n=1 Tax=Geopsychrobacter electrodiphilus TaxID=225196 RepID=UPI00035E4559|nr:KamA family radical SAM protein [Geopsychrobacter electrodiphilus]